MIVRPRNLRSKPHKLFILPIQRRTIFQSPITMAPRVIDTIKQDHRELEAYYNHITKSSEKDDQTRYQNQFIWELARHSIGEELVLYPAFEKHLHDGSVLADKDRQEHQNVRILWE